MVKYINRSLDSVFDALSDPIRREIIGMISKDNPNVSDLARPFNISLPAVSRHLKVLEHAGLIRRIKNGREYHFKIVSRPFVQISAWIDTYEAYWKRH